MLERWPTNFNPFGAELQAHRNIHRVMRINKMGIMVKSAIPTGTGMTRLVIPILSSGYSIRMTKQATKTIFQTSGTVKPHTKCMTIKKIPKLKGYLRLKATASFVSYSDWNEPDPASPLINTTNYIIPVIFLIREYMGNLLRRKRKGPCRKDCEQEPIFCKGLLLQLPLFFHIPST